MQITSSDPSSQVQGMQANNFQLTNSAKIIDIVINKMYTNKPGAVIRELASNAWDAHCVAGNTETPFEIHLPTWLDQTFMIRDYGCGIPHDQFEFIYTNIGGSTKDTSNDLIGGFGLGSKTPFTMVDQFTVENWYGGVKTTWLCFKNAGNPQVTKLLEEPSTEPTGVKVSFTFEESLVREFTTELTKQLRYFPVKPKVTGGEGTIKFPELPDNWEKLEYFYTASEHSWQSHHYVIMGNVCYDLSSSLLDSRYNRLFDKSLTLKVPIGSVDIPPSRENIEYTKKTKDFLNSMLEKITKDYVNAFETQMKSCSNEADFFKLVYNSNRNLLSNRVTLEYKGDKRNWSTYHSNYFVPIGLPIKQIETRYANVLRSCKVRGSALNVGIVLYVNDLGKGSNRTINEKHAEILSGAYIIDPPQGTKDTRQALLDEAISKTKEIFGVTPINLSTLITVTAPVKSANRTEANQVFKLVKAGSTVRSCLQEHTGDIPKEGYCLPLNGWKTEGHFNECLPELASWGLHDDPIYLVRKKTLPKCAHLKDEEQLIKDIKPKYESILKEHDIFSNTMAMFPLIMVSSSPLGIDWKGTELEEFFKLHSKYKAPKSTKGAPVLFKRDRASTTLLTKKEEKFIKEIKEKYQEIIQSLSRGWNVSGNLKTFKTFLLNNK